MYISGCWQAPETYLTHAERQTDRQTEQTKQYRYRSFIEEIMKNVEIIQLKIMGSIGNASCTDRNTMSSFL